MWDERYYPMVVNGTSYNLPSVTTILGVHNNPALNRWRANLGTEAAELYSEQTADIGKESHLFVAQLSQGKAISKLLWSQLDETIKNGIRAYERFRQKTNLITIESEKVVYHLGLHYAGTLDRWGIIKGEEAICDWKTGSRFFPAHMAQVVAYYKALRAMGLGTKVRRLYAVNLNRETGNYSPHSIPTSECAPYWAYFKACLNLFTEAKAIGKLDDPT